MFSHSTSDQSSLELQEKPSHNPSLQNNPFKSKSLPYYFGSCHDALQIPKTTMSSIISLPPEIPRMGFQYLNVLYSDPEHLLSDSSSDLMCTM